MWVKIPQVVPAGASPLGHSAGLTTSRLAWGDRKPIGGACEYEERLGIAIRMVLAWTLKTKKGDGHMDQCTSVNTRRPAGVVLVVQRAGLPGKIRKQATRGLKLYREGELKHCLARCCCQRKRGKHTPII